MDSFGLGHISDILSSSFATVLPHIDFGSCTGSERWHSRCTTAVDNIDVSVCNRPDYDDSCEPFSHNPTRCDFCRKPKLCNWSTSCLFRSTNFDFSPDSVFCKSCRYSFSFDFAEWSDISISSAERSTSSKPRNCSNTDYTDNDHGRSACNSYIRQSTSDYSHN
uniref:Uncharacterized protein n=1 Tax=Cacopsylla melanoneura TaxID=428564 RepID=A0A8D8SSR5_9HEMI